MKRPKSTQEDELDARIAKYVQGIENRHRKDIEVLENRLVALEDQHQKDIQELKGQHQKDIQELKGQHKKDIQELKGQHQTDIQELKDQLRVSPSTHTDPGMDMSRSSEVLSNPASAVEKCFITVLMHVFGGLNYDEIMRRTTPAIAEIQGVNAGLASVEHCNLYIVLSTMESNGWFA